MSTAQRLFDPRVLFGMILAGGLAAAGMIYLFAFGDLFYASGLAGRNSYSVSAIGHKAMVELLRLRGYAVISSRFDSDARAGDGLLVLAEPSRNSFDDNPTLDPEALDDFLLVLPKRYAIPDPTQPSWALSTPMLALDGIAPVAEPLGIKLKISRLESSSGSGWRNVLGGATPALANAQLMAPHPDLTPLIEAKEGVLFGVVQTDGRSFAVLSDADLLANHGLDDGANAEVALAIFEYLAEPGLPVVFDETIHGFVEAPNPVRRALEPPLLPVTLSLLAAGLLFGWSAATRFGAPRRVKRAFELGKSVLIGNMADLLLHGGYRREAVTRYFETAWREVADVLQAPHDDFDRDFDRLAGWFEEVGERRQVRASFIELNRRVAAIADGRVRDNDSLVATARDIHAWREEMLHGSRRDQTDR